MRSRLSSRHLVGRAGQLAELELAVREASQGHPALVLLGGDSGVGKTRLIGELARRLAEGLQPGVAAGATTGLAAGAATRVPAAGAATRVPAAGAATRVPAAGGGTETPLLLRGDAIDQADGELPYVPLLSALRPLVRERHPAIEALPAAVSAQLATILPGLATSAPGGAATPAPPADRDQLRLFEAILELLDRLADDATVVLVLEDMHWADRSTRSFIAFLARALRRERLCLVLTYRSDELHRRHPLRPLLAELERLELTRALELLPLDRAELTEALTDILGAAPDEGRVDRLFARSEGNPLFCEELLAAGLDGRGATPQSLRDAFLSRIERLSADGQLIAHAIAVARTADEPTLAALTGLEIDRLREALRGALAEQILVGDDEGRFCFRHALLREVVVDELLPGERVALHLAMARRLEAEPEGGSPAERLRRAAAIAGHYQAARDQPAALRTTVAAARAAEEAIAYGEAAALRERALELWPRVPDPAQTAGCDHAELLAAAATAYSVIEERTRSEELLRAALDEVDPDRAPARHAQLAGRLARILWSLNRGEEADQTAHRALALLGEDDRSEARALLLARLARNLVLRGRLTEAVAAGETALTVAVAGGHRVAEGEVLDTLGMAHVSLGRVEPGLALLRRAIDIARVNEDPDSLATATANLADMLSNVGRTQEALNTAQQGLAIIPAQLTRTHLWMQLTVSEMAFEAGEWALARRMLLADPDRTSGNLRIFGWLRRAELELASGSESAARASLDAVSGLVLDTLESQFIGLHGALTAELRLREGDLDGARAVIRAALDRIELCTDDIVRIARVSLIGVSVEAEQALRARDLRDPGRRRRALAEARIHVDRLAAAASAGGPVEAARLAHARAELARARGRAATRDWRAAGLAWTAIDRPYPAALALWREAEALVTAGDREPASRVAAEAAQAAERLGAIWLGAEVRRLRERARLRQEVEPAVANVDGRPDGDGTGAMGDPEDPFGLTPRERQVLALIAEGATNRQIGVALYMAEKTASVHVSRILAKLGVRGRTEAAAVAHRRHLA